MMKKRPAHNILIVGGNFGFPFGSAAANRVRHLALGLISHGAKVKILHLTCSESQLEKAVNLQPRGCYQGIKFEYTTGTTFISKLFSARRYYELKGVFVALLRIVGQRRRGALDWVYLYERDARVTVPVISLCRLLKIPVILELNEWLPALGSYSPLQCFLFRVFTLRRVQGIVVISSYLRGLVAQNNVSMSGLVPVIEVPVMIDTEEFSSPDEVQPYILWCGALNSYRDATEFLVKVLGCLYDRGEDVKLFLVGKASPVTLGELKRVCKQLRIPDSRLFCTGYVDDESLKKLYRQATALLLPLFPGEKDMARFPTKITEYLTSGRPVVATAIGELTNYLIDGRNAYLATPDNVADFAEKIIEIFHNPVKAVEIGLEGQLLCQQNFSHKVHGLRIIQFVETMVSDMVVGECKLKKQG